MLLLILKLSPFNCTCPILVDGCPEKFSDGCDVQYGNKEIVPGGVVPPNIVILAAPLLLPKQLLLNSLIILDVFKGSYKVTLLEYEH